VLDGLLLRCLPALLYTCIAYWMVGMYPEVTRFFTFIFVLGTYRCVGVCVCGGGGVSGVVRFFTFT
jgi:hypothetical protein